VLAPVAVVDVTLSVPEVTAAARAFAICCATVKPVVEVENVYVNAGLPVLLPGTVTVGI
jgi:hypothetical protein